MIVNTYRMQQQVNAMLANQMQQQQRAMTLSTSATPFGCCNFFDRCTDELLSLHFAGGLPLLDWIGFTVGTECVKTFEYITFVRPTQSEGANTAGHLSDPCATPNGWEFGTAKMTIEDFGRYGRLGPTRNIMQPMKYCMTDPRKRLDGSDVTDEREWDMRFTMETIIQDLSKDLIVGNASTAGTMNGLENIVKTGYASPMLDSWAVDWNGNTMAGGAGITVNGAAIGATFDFIDVLEAIVRRIKARIGWSPLLNTQQMNLGDLILLMPTHTAECLLDFYTCWSVCNSTEDLTVMLNLPEARAFRRQIMGGLYGYGQITIDGIPIPIMGYDWELVKSATLSDIYLLTGGVGSVKLWYGEHLSAATAATTFGNSGYFATDGGRVLGLWETENECYHLKEWIHPRIYTRAPWAQVRFQDVTCSTVLDPLSPDPESSFYPLTSFAPSVCP
ncbi:MAG TPA: hypothetical protein DEP36_08665 [Gammaproteobacteria bacterium]|nr:hypothetical protein [Gammaproteobacteria bacterium]